MASDLTPEEIAALRAEALSGSGRQRRPRKDLWLKLLDMAERCADYDRRLSEVMPADFKDWFENSLREWPEVAAGTITNLRKREDWAMEQLARALEKASAYDKLRESQREQWSSITRDIVKAQNKQGDA